MALIIELKDGGEYELPKDSKTVFIHVGNMMIKIAREEDGVSADILQRYPKDGPVQIACAYAFNHEAPPPKKVR